MDAKSTDSPLFMRVLLDDLRTFASFENLDARLDLLLAQDSVAELYLRVLEGWKERFNATLVQNTLRFLLFSRRGIYENELQELLAQPQHSWSALYAPTLSRLRVVTCINCFIASCPFVTPFSIHVDSSPLAIPTSRRCASLVQR